MKKRINEISGQTLNAKQMKNLVGGTLAPLGCPNRCKIGDTSGTCSTTSTSNCYCSAGSTSQEGCK